MKTLILFVKIFTVLILTTSSFVCLMETSEKLDQTTNIMLIMLGLCSFVTSLIIASRFDSAS